MELKAIMGIIFKRFWLVVLIPVILGGAMAYYSIYSYVPLYEARTTLYVMNSGSSRPDAEMQADIEMARVLVNDYRELVKSKLITSAIIEQLNLEGINPEMLSSRIFVNAKEGTRIIIISAIDYSPAISRDIANKTGELFAQRAIELMGVDSVSTIDRASTPEYPINSQSYKNVIMAVVLGVGLAITIILFLEYLDDRVKTREDIEKNLGIRVLGVIPVFNIK